MGPIGKHMGRTGVRAISVILAQQVGVVRFLTHLRQLEILTSCFTLIFRAEKATWHYITPNSCIFGFEGQSTAHFAVGWPLQRVSCGFALHTVVSRSQPSREEMLRRPARTPTESWLWTVKSNQISDDVARHFVKISGAR